MTLVSRRTIGLLGLAGLCSCAPVIQSASTPPTGFLGPSLTSEAMVAADGVRLPVMMWQATDQAGRPKEPWAVILALHGMDDYANANVVAGPYWAARGVTTYAYDQRGFGRAPGRGLWPKEDLLRQDLNTACTLLRARYPKSIIAVVGESMGGAVAITAFASKQPPDADRLVLLSPAVWGWAAQPWQNSLALWVAAHTVPGEKLTPPAWVYRHHLASDNLAVLRQMGRDRNLIFDTRVDAAYGLMNLMEHAREEISQIRAPTLYAYGAHDTMIPKPAAIFAAARLGPNGRTAYYVDGWHLLNRDLHASVVLEDVLSFIRDPAAPLPSGAPPIPKPGP